MEENIKNAIEEAKRQLEIERKLKAYTYLVECITETTKYQAIQGVAQTFDEAVEIFNKWNIKLESEGKPKLNCIAVLEGEYRRAGFKDQQLIIPIRYCPARLHKQTKEDLHRYYDKLIDVLK